MTERKFDIVIIGGGFSGTMLAVQLMRRDPSVSVAVIEKTGLPGRGVAYGTQNPAHLLNVSVGRMTALPDEPDHFLNWAQANYSPTVRSESFLPRLVYGRYIEALFKQATASSNGSLSWIQDEAISIARKGSRYAVTLTGTGKLAADVVILATGNLPPSNPRIPGLQSASQRTVRSAWSRDALEGLPQNGSVLLIGSGLSAVDVTIALDAKGYRGKIHVVSRHGLMPQCHGKRENWREFWRRQTNDESHQGCPRTARSLLRLIRDEVKAAEAMGIDWRSVIDALRPATQEIWKSLPHRERTRFLRHARAYWDTHRHRIAPEIDAVLQRLATEERLHIYAGRVTNCAEQPLGVEVTLRLRGTQQHRQINVDRIINCTGSESDCRKVDDSLLKSLFIEGLARPDSLYLGLNVNAEGFVLDYEGVPSRSLCAIGPPTKGGLWEAVAVPELRRQAAELAEQLARRFASQGEARTDEVVAHV